MSNYSNGLVVITLGTIPKAKLSRALKTGVLSLSASEVKGSDHRMLVHPSTARKLLMAERANKGVQGIPITHGEIISDLNTHGGGSLWSSIKSGLSKVGSFLSENADVLKPLATAGLDAIDKFAGNKTFSAVRDVGRELTGIGASDPVRAMRLKNLEKARLAKQQKKNKTCGGSFRI